MSISDRIVVMKEGIVQQIGKPQEVYDNPDNLFVARFLGTPPINVLEGRVKDKKLFLGQEAVLAVDGVADQEVYVGIRPEGFRLQEDGPLTCALSRVEVMGRDSSVVFTHEASLNPTVRSVLSTDAGVDFRVEHPEKAEGTKIRFAFVPRKVMLFHKKTEERIAATIQSF